MLVFVYHNIPACLVSNTLQLIGEHGEGKTFPKDKMCFQEQLSYIYTQVIKVNLWFKKIGYYIETLWALSQSKKHFCIHTITHRHNQPRTAPEIQVKVIEILFVVEKQNIPELWISPCITCTAASALYSASSFPQQMPFNSLTQIQFINPVLFPVHLN